MKVKNLRSMLLRYSAEDDVIIRMKTHVSDGWVSQVVFFQDIQTNGVVGMGGADGRGKIVIEASQTIQLQTKQCPSCSKTPEEV